MWADIEAGDVHSYQRASGDRTRWPVGAPLGSVRLAEDGRLVLALRGGVYLGDESARTIELIAHVDDDEREHRLNDSACDAAGRLWTGTMRLDATGRECALYRLGWNADGQSVHRMLDGVGISNGIGWSLDQTVMYFIDTPTHRVDAIEFDLPSGDLGRRRPLVDMEPARPDGMAVDAEGGLWVAVPSHGQVRRYSPRGKLDGVIDFPVRRVTSCCFGGPELDELYVTSARDPRVPPGTAASGGAVYRCRPGIRGAPAHHFRSRP